MKRLAFLALLIGVCGCTRKAVVVAPPAPPKPPETARLQRIWVQGFEGDGSGEMSRDVTRALKAAGLAAPSRQQADALLTGNVAKSKRKLMIYLGSTRTLSNNQAVVVSNPVVSARSSQVVPESAAVGTTNPSILAENTAMGVAAQLTEARTGALRWSYEFTYESLNLQDARQVLAAQLAQTLKNSLK
jgi:hypothetical protein